MQAKAAAFKNHKGKMTYYVIIQNIQGISATYAIRKTAYEKLENMQLHENKIIKTMEQKIDKTK